jgi:hypothetical protein
VRLRNDWYYTANDNGNPITLWRGGMYTNNAYNPNYGGASVTSPGAPANEFDGNTFYLQFRTKIQSSRWTAGNPDGKLAYISTTKKGNPSQELIITSANVWPWWTGATTNIYNMYTNNGNQFNSELRDPQTGGNGAQIQPSGIYPATCVVGNATTARCWMWPKDTWVTILIRVIPGKQTTNHSLNDPAAANTGVTVWTDWNDATQRRQNSFIKIWEKLDYIWEFGGAVSPAYPDDLPEGFSGFTASGFMNSGAQGTSSVVGWYQRYDQIIFSQQPIACPQV